MKHLAWLLILAIPGCPDEESERQDTELRILEAEGVIRVCEARLRTARSDLAQDQFQAAHDEDFFRRMEALHASHVVAHREVRAARLAMELSRIDVEKDRSEIAEAEADLELARVRKQIAGRSRHVYPRMDPRRRPRRP